MLKPKINDNILPIIKNLKRIAIVGISDKTYRDSYSVGKFMINQGYEIFPINPNLTEVLGRRCYPSLLDIDSKIDLVVIFRKSDSVIQIVEETIKIKAKAVWMQLNVVNENAAQIALDAALDVVMNRCWKIEYHNHIIY